MNSLLASKIALETHNALPFVFVQIALCRFNFPTPLVYDTPVGNAIKHVGSTAYIFPKKLPQTQSQYFTIKNARMVVPLLSSSRINTFQECTSACQNDTKCAATIFCDPNPDIVSWCSGSRTAANCGFVAGESVDQNQIEKEDFSCITFVSV